MAPSLWNAHQIKNKQKYTFTCGIFPNNLFHLRIIVSIDYVNVISKRIGEETSNAVDSVLQNGL